jgi:hypothetical protein
VLIKKYNTIFYKNLKNNSHGSKAMGGSENGVVIQDGASAQMTFSLSQHERHLIRKLSLLCDISIYDTFGRTEVFVNWGAF